MRGVLIHYDPQTDQGTIRGDDGKRYAFDGRDWRSEYEPMVNDEVDFGIDGAAAYDIHLLNVEPAGAPPPPPVAVPIRRAQDPEAASLLHRLFGDWAATFALLTLIGCMLPFLTIGSALNEHRQSSALLTTGRTVGQIIDIANRIENFGRSFQNPERVERSARNVQTLRWSLRIGYLLYLVPVFALWLIVARMFGKRARRLAVVQGVSSIALPILVPLAFSAAIYAQIPADARQFAQQLGGLFSVSFTGIGFWVMVVAGLAQLFACFGALRISPIDFLVKPRSQ